MSMFMSCFGSKEEREEAKNDQNNNDAESEGEKTEEEESEDELSKQEKRIMQAEQVFSERVKDLDKIFKNHPELLQCKLQPIHPPNDPHHVVGPTDNESSHGIEGVVYAKSVSSYPKKPRTKEGDLSKERLGDPICDCYSYETVDVMLVASVADGCNWGPKPLEAAHVATATFHAVVKERAHKFTTVRETGRQLLKAFSAAHTAILKAPLQREVYDIWETGTTTLLGGVLVPLAEEDARNSKTSYVFICASVGDCKAFRCSAADGTVTDITVGTRAPSAITNVNDPGGRLGPYVGKEGSADLRNLSLFILPCMKDDLLLLLSDGVYDNLDPQQLNIPTTDVGLEAESWEAANAEDAEGAKNVYRTRFIADKWKEIRAMDVEEGEGESEKGKQKKGQRDSSGGSDLVLLTDKLLEHSRQVTKYSRKWMQQHPTARMPDARSKKKDPLMLGKMDHTTCLAMHVGTSQLHKA